MIYPSLVREGGISPLTPDPLSRLDISQSPADAVTGRRRPPRAPAGLPGASAGRSRGRRGRVPAGWRGRSRWRGSGSSGSGFRTRCGRCDPTRGGGGMGLRGWVGGTGPDSGRFEGDAPRLAVSDRSYAMKRLFPLVRARMSTRSGSHGSSAACSGSYHRRHNPTSTAGQDACAYP